MFKLTRKSAQPSAQQPAQEQRKATHHPAQDGPEQASVLDRFGTLFTGYRFADVFSARHHSDDFKETRAEYINVRVRFMAFFFAIAVPMWAPIDYFTISPEHFPDMALARGVLSGVLILLGLLTLTKATYTKVNVLLGLVMLVPTAFYVVSILVLLSGQPEPPSVGYSFMPFLMVGLLGLFPLTLISGLLITAMVLSALVGLEFWLGQLMTLNTLNKLWLFLMFAGVSIWVQSGQLLMLLKLYRESTRDPLTGLINRRVLMKRLDAERSLNQDAKRPFSILMFDLDRFKRINDTYGHFTGDQVLKAAAHVLEVQLRRTDVIARFGGEEFVAVLPGLHGNEALQVAERIRQACRDTRVTAPNGEEIQLSTSVGVTEYESGEEVAVSLKRVDDSLYKAKELGRNRVVYSQSDLEQPQEATSPADAQTLSDFPQAV